MSGINRTQARGEIFSRVQTMWPTASAEIVGAATELRYQGVTYPQSPSVTTYWARLSLQIVSEDQETLRNGVRRFRSDGLAFVQLFYPTADTQVASKSDLLAEATRNIFRLRTPQDNIIFTRARINDNIDPEASWLRINVISEFEYVQFL